MATILLGSTIADIRGKVGGSTYKLGISGSHVLQHKSYRSNSNQGFASKSGITVPNKQVIQTLSQTWSTLTPAQQKLWNTSSVNFKYKDRVGSKRTYSGYALFMKINGQLATLAQSIIYTPPIASAITSQGVISISASGGYTVGVLNYATAIPSGYIMVISATRAFSLGKQPIKSDFKIIAQAPNGSANPFPIHTAYQKIFGISSTGGQVFVKAYFLSIALGQVSQASTASINT